MRIKTVSAMPECGGSGVDRLDSEPVDQDVRGGIVAHEDHQRRQIAQAQGEAGLQRPQDAKARHHLLLGKDDGLLRVHHAP